MKKFLALLLVVASIFSFAACFGGGKEEAKEVAEGFLNAYCDFDFEKAKEYLDDPSEMPGDIEDLDANKVADTLPAELSAYKDDFKEVFEAMIDKMKAEIEYEIKDVKEDGDEVIVTVEVVVPTENEDAVNEFTSNLGEQFNENTVTDMFIELYGSGEITESSTYPEVIDLIMGKFIETAKEGIKSMSIETEKKEMKIHLYKEEGKWIIDSEKSFE